MSDVGDKILAQFGTCLAEELTSERPPRPRDVAHSAFRQERSEAAIERDVAEARQALAGAVDDLGRRPTPPSGPSTVKQPDVELSAFGPDGPGSSRLTQLKSAKTTTATSGTNTPTIFISYRRADTAAVAEILYAAAEQTLGPEHVFTDVDSIAPGDDFVDAINLAVASCDVILVLIGDRWLTIRDGRGTRRLDDQADFVRLEIEMALTHGVRIVPILFGAVMPAPRDLPPSIAALARRQAVELRPGRLRDGAQRLVDSLWRRDQNVRRT